MLKLILIFALSFIAISCSNYKIHRSINKQIVKMHFEEQNIRRKVHFASTKTDVDSIYITELRKDYEVIHRNNEAYIKEVFDKFGWPKWQSSNAFGGTYLIIYHSNADMMDQSIPYLKKKISKGVYKWNQHLVAQLEDRIRMLRGQKQIYGTDFRWLYYEDGTRKAFIWPVEDPNQLDYLRSTVKLAPLDKFLKKKHNKFITYDPTLTISDFELYSN